MVKFVAYYRVSTERQRVSGLGLEAQREAVSRHVGTGQLVAEFTETESCKRHTNRPQLLATLAECRKRRAVLLIGRLDRLARNVAFIANPMESGADFIAYDMPKANRLNIRPGRGRECTEPVLNTGLWHDARCLVPFLLSSLPVTRNTDGAKSP